MARIKYQEAAGLEVKRGRPPAGPAPSKADLVKLYVREGRSVRDVAAGLGCSKDMVHRGLRKYGIEVRTSARRSALEKAEPSRLYSDLIEKGVEGTAAGLGVTKRTLQYFLAKKRRPEEINKVAPTGTTKGKAEGGL